MNFKKIMIIMMACALLHAVGAQAKVTVSNHSGSKNYRVSFPNPSRGKGVRETLSPGQTDTTPANAGFITIEQRCDNKTKRIAKFAISAGRTFVIEGDHYTSSWAFFHPQTKLIPACEHGQNW